MCVNAVIEVTAVRKRFGPVLALDGMSFAVMPGRVTGFAGANGAGKSTTMRVILGLDAPQEGTALVGGRPYRSLALTVSGLPAERIVAVLSHSGVAFCEVAAHRASLEEAYMRLTADAADYRAVAAEEVAR
jgi:ABC-2 type transport system ATP-binding protein